jgi:regulatory factor X 1/2/3
MNNGSCEQIGSAGAYQTDGTTTTVGSPYYFILTPIDSNIGAAQGLQPTYVNHVGGVADQTIYATTNGQISYTVQTVVGAGAMHNTASDQQYTMNTTAVTNSPMKNNSAQGTNVGQLLDQGNAAYLIQQGFDPGTAHTLTATADAGKESWTMVPRNATSSPSTLDGDEHLDRSLTNPTALATIQWVWENFEAAEGMSFLCSTMYDHYVRHCKENELNPLDKIAFGKFIRVFFIGVNTRRLGTRGNSKYHYYGIRVKPESALEQVSEDGNSAVRKRLTSQEPYKFLSGSDGSGSGTQNMENQYEQNTNHSGNSNHFNSAPQHFHHHQYLGNASMPEFPDIEFPTGLALPEGCTLRDVDTLRSIYREHCDAFLYAVVNLEFHRVEGLWREFWRSQDDIDNRCGDGKHLSKTKLYLLCSCGPVQQFVWRVDHLFYQNLVDILIPDVLSPIPSSLTQEIRKFANELQSWLTGAMTNCPEEMINIKVSAVNAFAQTLRRYTSLNHIAQAARPVLQNSSEADQMLVDLNQVDFRNVRERASWVCQCDDSMLQLEEDFKKTLHQQNSLEQRATWMKGVVTQVLKPYKGKPNFAEAAKEFLLKWSFYISVVIRDLTLLGAASFGSLHLLSLLYDEYMFYLIQHQVALETRETPIAIMEEKNSNNPSSETSSNQGLMMGSSLAPWEFLSLLEGDGSNNPSCWN